MHEAQDEWSRKPIKTTKKKAVTKKKTKSSYQQPLRILNQQKTVIKPATKKGIKNLSVQPVQPVQPIQPVQIPFQTRKSVINLPTSKLSIIKIVNNSSANKSAFEFSFMKDDNKENLTSSFVNGTEDSNEKINLMNDIFYNNNNLDINFNQDLIDLF
jgi:hypothetical protein